MPGGVHLRYRGWARRAETVGAAVPPASDPHSGVIDDDYIRSDATELDSDLAGQEQYVIQLWPEIS